MIYQQFAAKVVLFELRLLENATCSLVTEMPTKREAT